jgi:hypothetical protein
MPAGDGISRAVGPMSSDFAPGVLVRLPARPDWGIGQVQSAIGPHVTVNFEHAGKKTINATVVELQIVAPDER